MPLVPRAYMDRDHQHNDDGRHPPYESVQGNQMITYQTTYCTIKNCGRTIGKVEVSRRTLSDEELRDIKKLWRQ